jgi:hypothetical protein
MSELSTRRPGSVTFVVVLTWIIAILDLAIGGLLLFASFNQDLLDDVGASVGDARAYGFSMLAIGLLTAVVAVALAGGSGVSRVVVITLMVLRIALGVWALVTVGGNTVWGAIAEIVFGVLIIGMLSTRRASAFFGARP